MSIADLRKEYRHATLDESGADRDPLVQFNRWFDEAQAAKVRGIRMRCARGR